MKWVNPTTRAKVNPISPAPVITGIYEKISFLTPVLDVYGVDPVKLRARYAVRAGITSNNEIIDVMLTQSGAIGTPEINAIMAKGIATMNPRNKPFVLKSTVGR